jgi:hypothetical protein
MMLMIMMIVFRMEENEHGMTPLLCAAERCQAFMVEFFIGKTLLFLSADRPCILTISF